MAVLLRENERIDELTTTGKKIIQNDREFCFSLDAVLLAHFPQISPRSTVLDLGTGTGVMPLLLADSVAHVDAVEISPVMAEMAQRSVELNGLQEKITVKQGDYRQMGALYPRESFDWVLVNPPYRPVPQGKVNDLPGVAAARHEVTAKLADVVRAARYALRFRGRLAMVHLPERLAEIFAQLKANQLEPKRLQFVQPKPDKAPNMLLLEATCGGVPGGLKVLPPLIVHKEDGGYTDEVLKYYA